MNENIKNGGDEKLITKLKVLFQSSNKRENFDKLRVLEINNGISQFKSRTYNTDFMYAKFLTKLEMKRKNQKRFILVTACAVIILSGVAAYANYKGLFTHFASQHSIQINNTEEIAGVEITTKVYPDLETAAKDLKFKLPYLSDLPNGLSVVKVSAEFLQGVTRIYVNYSDDKIFMRYDYYDDKDNILGVMDVNSTYKNPETVQTKIGTAYLYSDRERLIVLMQYDNFVINLDTNYTSEQKSELIEILENIKFTG